jgi:cobalt-zinc-cadmium resistance protein CzcA
VPSLNEGDIALHALRVPGTSLSQAVEMQTELERTIKQFPEVDRIFAKMGTAEIATDPMPPNVADNFVMIKPQSEWPNPSRSKADLIDAMRQAVTKVPGNNYEFTQPIQMRFNELISGVRSDVAVKVFGDDMDTMNNTADKISNVLAKIPGATDVKVEQTTGLPILTIKIDREKTARYGVSVGDVQDTIAIAMGGQTAGVLFQGDRRFDIVVRLPEKLRSDMEALKRLPIRLPDGQANDRFRSNYLQLGDVEHFGASGRPPSNYIQLMYGNGILVRSSPQPNRRFSKRFRYLLAIGQPGAALSNKCNQRQSACGLWSLSHYCLYLYCCLRCLIT